MINSQAQSIILLFIDSKYILSNLANILMSGLLEHAPQLSNKHRHLTPGDRSNTSIDDEVANHIQTMPDGRSSAFKLIQSDSSPFKRLTTPSTDLPSPGRQELAFMNEHDLQSEIELHDSIDNGPPPLLFLVPPVPMLEDYVVEDPKGNHGHVPRDPFESSDKHYTSSAMSSLLAAAQIVEHEATMNSASEPIQHMVGALKYADDSWRVGFTFSFIQQSFTCIIATVCSLLPIT